MLIGKECRLQYDVSDEAVNNEADDKHDPWRLLTDLREWAEEEVDYE